MASFADEIADIARPRSMEYVAGMAEGNERGANAQRLEIAIDALRRIALPAGADAGLEGDMERAMRLCAQAALNRIWGKS